jgi:hypothetical protein
MQYTCHMLFSIIIYIFSTYIYECGVLQAELHVPLYFKRPKIPISNLQKILKKNPSGSQ